MNLQIGPGACARYEVRRNLCVPGASSPTFGAKYRHGWARQKRCLKREGVPQDEPSLCNPLGRIVAESISRPKARAGNHAGAETPTGETDIPADGADQRPASSVFVAKAPLTKPLISPPSWRRHPSPNTSTPPNSASGHTQAPGVSIRGAVLSHVRAHGRAKRSRDRRNSECNPST